MVAVDKQWYLDVNGFARHTAWAHRFLTDLYDRALSPVGAGLLALAALVLLAWWSARRQRERMVAVIWSGLGALISFGLAQILLKALAKPRPYEVLHNVEVLVPRLGHSSYALPDSHSVVAGAVLCGLLLARRWRIGALALLVS
ncbi:MAG TPA: hypothetical protein VK425_12210, partial [Acidimicrobiales bacterium]|nr:hypothetical protein [Acidimicrobiales bacterium]